MKITGNRLGVIAPSPVRRKRLGGPLPPWHDEVPPDTIDIELLPRFNRYERGPLRFHHFGSTQRKLSERVALFRDAMDELEPGLAHSHADMMDGLKEVMEGRRHMMTERQLRAFDLRAAIADSLADDQMIEEQVETEDVENEDIHDDEADASLSSILDDEIEGESVGRSGSTELRVASKDKTVTTVAQDNKEPEELIEGAPTQWLLDRLSAAGAS